MTESSPDDSNSKRKDFICGVVEGFYGRPWTTEQRKDLFQKLKKWGMDMYVYAPKDDYKHRAYWRELYTVEEAEHLTSLISAARDQGIEFCYALSPGLDITYSNQKEITTLKRKLEQVSQFGCTCFALLFDDIEPEMSESDKQIFQSFAHAQVSITNEIHQHLGCPRFLLCPTQYCSSRAVPTVNSSEYLNTLGTKLSQQIDIMWTGPKVISKTLTTECIEEITAVLRRPPVIWDNLHANDYDHKRIFLGPYCGRSPELIPLLRGVLTNPNCEYNANMVAIWTLAHWARCSLAAPQHMEAVSWDIKLERESESGVCEDESPLALGKHVYHHRQALRQAITDWLPEFAIPKISQGPVIKPSPQVTDNSDAPWAETQDELASERSEEGEGPVRAVLNLKLSIKTKPMIDQRVPPVPIIPILPSVNTCMSLVTSTLNTSTTCTAEMTPIPTVSTSQLQVSPVENFSPVSNPVMNSLVSPTKVILNDSIPNPIIPIASSNMTVPSEIPVSTLTVPILGLKTVEENGREISMDKEGNESNDSVLETASFIEDMKKEKEEDNIIVDDEVTQQNGDMSVGDTPQTLSPQRGPGAGGAEGEPLDVDPPAAPADCDVIMQDHNSEMGSMQVEASHSPLSGDMVIEPPEPTDPVDVERSDAVLEAIQDDVSPCALNEEDLLLLCDLFYLPFEHGSRGLRLLHDFNWLMTHAGSMLPRAGNKPETSEWRRRRGRFQWWAGRARRLARRLARANNGELRAELRPYVWDLCAVIALLHGFVCWLELGKFPNNITSYTQGTYTWFSKGWKEAFESGSQEPWVFRGGLAADLRRLLPIECAGAAGAADLRGAPAVSPPPRGPPMLPLIVRPYTPLDEVAICTICHKTCRDGSDCSDLFPADLQSLPADRLVAPFLTLTPEFCMVLEDDEADETRETSDADDTKFNGTKPEIVGYACACLNSKEFYQKQEIAWIPEMCVKYPEQLCERDDLSHAAKECIRHFHQFTSVERAPEAVTRQYPALLTCCMLPSADGRDPLGHARLLTCLLAALRANGATGVHACINATDVNLQQFYSKLGFVEAWRADSGRLYLARAF